MEPISDQMQFIARVEAIESVELRARVQGFLETVAFQAGQQVSAGELLFEIEADRYEAAVASARAGVSQAEARQREASRNLTRMQNLTERQSVSRAALDEAQANAEIAEANLAAAQAQLTAAELDLSYTRITAPIDGEISRTYFSSGDLLGPESGPLADIIQSDPIRVVFSLSEGALVTLRQQANQQDLQASAGLQLTLHLPNGSDYDQQGRIEYIANQVDPQTGTVPVRAIFPNPGRLLLPNQSVTLLVREEDAPELPVVPQSAVLRDQQGQFVFVLEEDDRVSQRRIETGTRVSRGWAVTSGLADGDIVVVQGIQRLSDGAQVRAIQSEPRGNDNP